VARIGLMLYTVRKACASDFEGTLREVADIGYAGVELVELHGHAAEEVAGWLSELELEVAGRHARLETMESDLQSLAEEAKTLGYRRLFVPLVDPSALDDAMLARIAAVRGPVQEAGLELGYHNHDAEIRQGFLDRLPEGVALELDAGWTWWAGADPVDYLGRGPTVHVKDFKDRETRSYCPIGDGAIDYGRIAPAAVEAGAEWLLVEQDESEGPEIEAARRSYGALTAILDGVA
jgi:sugar phosphate isomerase/epimerase